MCLIWKLRCCLYHQYVPVRSGTWTQDLWIMFLAFQRHPSLVFLCWNTTLETWIAYKYQLLVPPVMHIYIISNPLKVPVYMYNVTSSLKRGIIAIGSTDWLSLQQRGPTFLSPWHSTARKMKLNKLCVKIEIRLVESMTVRQACKAIKKRINDRESVNALQMSQL